MAERSLTGNASAGLWTHRNDEHVDRLGQPGSAALDGRQLAGRASITEASDALGGLWVTPEGELWRGKNIVRLRGSPGAVIAHLRERPKRTSTRSSDATRRDAIDPSVVHARGARVGGGPRALPRHWATKRHCAPQTGRAICRARAMMPTKALPTPAARTSAILGGLTA